MGQLEPALESFSLMPEIAEAISQLGLLLGRILPSQPPHWKEGIRPFETITI